MLSSAFIEQFFNLIPALKYLVEPPDVKTLIKESFPDLNAIDETGKTLLHHAILRAEVMVVDVLLEDLAEFLAYDRKDGSGNSPLHLAIMAFNPANDLDNSYFILVNIMKQYYKYTKEGRLIQNQGDAYKKLELAIPLEELFLRQNKQDQSVVSLMEDVHNPAEYRTALYRAILNTLLGDFNRNRIVDSIIGHEELLIKLIASSISAQKQVSEESLVICIGHSRHEYPVEIACFLHGLMHNNIKLVNLIESNTDFNLTPRQKACDDVILDDFVGFLDINFESFNDVTLIPNYLSQPIDHNVELLIKAITKMIEMGVLQPEGVSNYHPYDDEGENFLSIACYFESPHFIFWLLDQKYFSLNDLQSSTLFVGDYKMAIQPPLTVLAKRIYSEKALQIMSEENLFTEFKKHYLIYKKEQFEKKCAQYEQNDLFHEAYDLCKSCCEDRDFPVEMKELANLKIAELIFTDKISVQEIKSINEQVDVTDEKVMRMWQAVQAYPYVCSNSHENAQILKRQFEGILSGKTFVSSPIGDAPVIWPDVVFRFFIIYSKAMENVPQEIFRLIMQQAELREQQLKTSLAEANTTRNVAESHPLADSRVGEKRGHSTAFYGQTAQHTANNNLSSELQPE